MPSTRTTSTSPSPATDPVTIETTRVETGPVELTPDELARVAGGFGPAGTWSSDAATQGPAGTW